VSFTYIPAGAEVDDTAKTATVENNPVTEVASGAKTLASRTVVYEIEIKDGVSDSDANTFDGDDAKGAAISRVIKAILEGEDDGSTKKIISITADLVTVKTPFVADPSRRSLLAATPGVYTTKITVVYADEPELIAEDDMEDYFQQAASDYAAEASPLADDISLSSFAIQPVKGYAWEAQGNGDAGTDAPDAEYRTVEYEATFTSDVNLAGKENFFTEQLAPKLIDQLDSADVVVTMSATTIAKAKASSATRRLADTTYTYTSTVAVVYASVAASKLDLGLPKETDKGMRKVQAALEATAEILDYDVEDDNAANYIDITAKSFTRVTPLVEGSKAARTDLTTSADSEASRTLTVSAEFTSTKKFTSSEITDLEGQISDQVMDLDTNDNILSVETDVAEQAAAAARRLLATTYSYDSTSTVITVSATAAADAKTLLATELTAAGFKTILADAASAAGISGATFVVATAPGVVGAAAADSSAASAAILGGALGLFAAVAALL
jgi:hypothetical protein